MYIWTLWRYTSKIHHNSCKTHTKNKIISVINDIIMTIVYLKMVTEFIEMWFCTIIDMFLDFKTSYVMYYLQLIRSFLCVILDYKIEKEKRIPIKLLRFLFITSSAYITNQMYFCCPKNILQLSNFNMYF